MNDTHDPRNPRALQGVFVNEKRGTIQILKVGDTVLVESQSEAGKWYQMGINYECSCRAYYYRLDCSHTRAARAAYPRKMRCRPCGAEMTFDHPSNVCPACFEKGER